MCEHVFCLLNRVHLHVHFLASSPAMCSPSCLQFHCVFTFQPPALPCVHLPPSSPPVCSASSLQSHRVFTFQPPAPPCVHLPPSSPAVCSSSSLKPCHVVIFQPPAPLSEDHPRPSSHRFGCCGLRFGRLIVWR